MKGKFSGSYGARQESRHNKPPEWQSVIDAWVVPMAPHIQPMRLGRDGLGDRNMGEA